MDKAQAQKMLQFTAKADPRRLDAAIKSLPNVSSKNGVYFVQSDSSDRIYEIDPTNPTCSCAYATGQRSKSFGDVKICRHNLAVLAKVHGLNLAAAKPKEEAKHIRLFFVAPEGIDERFVDTAIEASKVQKAMAAQYKVRQGLIRTQLVKL